MAFFSKKSEGGVLNVIRSPEDDYLVHKWRPSGEAGDTKRENTIRWGSSLRVRDGETAVFVYSQNGQAQDFIEGPFDQLLKTANMPVLSSIVGLAYGGDSPFQAQVYFINRAGTQQLNFRLPWFEVAESQPNLETFTVPCSVQGTVYFSIDDVRAFIKMNRLTDFDLDRFREKLMPMLQSRIKGVVMNTGSKLNIPLVQLERAIDFVRQESTTRLSELFEQQFGTRVVSVEISAIELKKDSEGYAQLKAVTTDLVLETKNVMAKVERQNLKDGQAINAENLSETMRLQREQLELAQGLQTKQQYIGAYALEKQSEVLKAGAESLGKAGTVNTGGFNPAGVMMGIGLGGAMTGQMTGMLAGLGTPGMGMGAVPMAPGAPVIPPAPPPAGPPPVPLAHGGPSQGGPPVQATPALQYFMSTGGVQYGPYPMQQLQAFVATGQFTAAHLVWREGLPAWQPASQVTELASLFGATGGGMPPVSPPAV